MLASAPWQSLIGPQNITLACNSCASQAGKKNLARILNASLKSKPLHLLLPLKREARLSVLCILQSGAPTLCGTSSSSSTVDPLPAAIVWGNLTMQCVNYIVWFSFLSDPSPIIGNACQWLSDSLTHSCLVNLIDATLACEDGNSKFIEVVTVADVDDEDRVGNSLLQIWKLTFGPKAKLLFRLWAQGFVKILKLKFKQDLYVQHFANDVL